MKKVIEHSALIYALLIFLGYSYMDTYYSLFGIEIHNFLDASEILLSFLSNINYIVFALAFLSAPYFVSFLIGNIKLKQTEKTVESTSPKRKRVISIIQLVILACFGIYSTIDLLKMIIDNPYVSIVMLLFFIIIGIWIFVIIKMPAFLEKINFTGNKYFQQIILNIIFICFFNYFCSIVKYNLVKDQLDKTEVTFTYDNLNYSSNDSILLIGTTSKYVFMKNMKNKYVFVFEKDKINHFKQRIRKKQGKSRD